MIKLINMIDILLLLLTIIINIIMIFVMSPLVDQRSVTMRIGRVLERFPRWPLASDTKERESGATAVSLCLFFFALAQEGGS